MTGALLERVRERVVTTSAVVGVLILEPVERWIGRRSPVGDTPFYDVAQFPVDRRARASLPPRPCSSTTPWRCGCRAPAGSSRSWPGITGRAPSGDAR
jgi:hypothetical protein